MSVEVLLAGGNSNPEVVRVGDTVRRKQGASSMAVHGLLRFLNDHGFTQAPRFLGVDEQGREILSYIEGRCGVLPEYWTDEKYLVSAAVLLRDLHAASAAYVVNTNETWGYQYPDKNRHEVICHNDFGPYNLISNGSEFVAVIDFDLAGPGPRLRDIAYAAYWLTPVSQRADDMKAFARRDIANSSARLKKFCRICGVTADTDLLDMIAEVLHYMANEDAMIQTIGQCAADQLKADGHLEHWAGEATAFDRYRSSIEANL